MHKQFLIQSVVSIFFVAAISCSTKKENTETEEPEHHEHDVTAEEWKEMDDFHMVMAESFHPFKDSANLEPAKENAPALVASAEKWMNSPLPEKFKEDDEIKFKLTQLKSDASTFEEVVKTGDDKSIGDSLTKLHDLFHEIQESWYGEKGHH